jgi:hypothetical protein
MAPTDAEKAAYAARYYSESEAKVEAAACRYAKSLGYFHRKYKTPEHRGAPDRQFKHKLTREFYIEFKKPTVKKPSKQQRLVIDEMREDYGFIVFVTNDLGVAKRILDEMLMFGECDA